MINATDLKNGTIYKESGHPFVVVKYEHVKTARGGATVKVKAKNLVTDQVLTKSYSHTTRVDEADVVTKSAQFLYTDGDYIFMDPVTFSQVSVAEGVMGDAAKFLREGETVRLVYFEGTPVSLELPNNIVFEIAYTEPGYKGNTVNNSFKDATLSNGTHVKVPTFIKIGDKVKIDTRTGAYVSKA
jgi:elongation factor P